MAQVIADLLSEDLRDRSLGPKAAAAAPATAGTAATGGSRDLVLLWIRGAMRAHSNPALEAAVQIARGLDLPLLVYQALDERHPYASDRLWRFALEGARDLSEGLAARGIRYAFHLTRPGHRTPALKTLSQRAAVIVADVHPVEPIRTWTECVAAAPGAAPLVQVDASCVVPVTATDQAIERAFTFRKKTSKHRRRWVGWEPEESPAPRRYEGALPFEPLNFNGADFPALIAACSIDHGIAPVGNTVGGTRAAQARWGAFREGGLARYARDRNDPLRAGVSRMSPYLHFGMASAFQLVAESHRIGGPGAAKFLDELLVWRESAWHFCHHVRNVDSSAALPEWARETLREHEADPRPALLSWDTLAHAQTGDELWDAMQTSLLRRGELHNNLRMTWGKAVLPWTPNAEVALERLLDLNHRYALDGRDPASYGGILWCLGQFDRPFPPAQPILGTVRERTTQTHAQRIDLDTYKARVSEPSSGPSLRIAVIGAGIAGLSAARALVDAGHHVEVFDKGRGVGGRTSLRRRDPFAFDHGAQYFTARDPRFRRFVDAWVEEGVVAPFSARLAVIDAPGGARERDGAQGAGAPPERFVGLPGMNAMAVRMAQGLNLRTATRVAGFTRSEGSAEGTRSPWTLQFEDGASTAAFDWVLVTAPPPQTAELVAASAPLAAIASSVPMAPCWAAMVAFEEPFPADFDGAFINAGPLSWAARNSAKPGRPPGDAWVLHGSPAWTAEHLELTKEDAATQLVQALSEAAGHALPKVLHQDAHRWMYSAAAPPREDESHVDAELQLGIAGDWLGGSKVQGAWLSGRALAGRILGASSAPSPDDLGER